VISPTLSIPTFLAGARARLRPLVSADVDGPYLAWFNDREVCRLNSHHVFPYTRTEALAWIAALSERPDALVLAIELDNRHVGNVSLQGIDPVGRSAELAIVLGDRSVWGDGIGGEAAELLVAHGFRALNLHRIACATVAANHGMRRLAERLGMTQEGVRRDAVWTDGSYHDIVEYGLLTGEWETRS
jgi:RimJ/RimL family protein N-acetyltransferase